MAEQPIPPLSPQDIHSLQDGIFDQWQKLPTEHQATITLVLLTRLLEGEFGPWMMAAIEMLRKEKSPLYSKTLPVPQISHNDLKQTNLTAEEIAQLTEEDLRHITHEVAEHYANDAFREEIEFIAHVVLAEKDLR